MNKQKKSSEINYEMMNLVNGELKEAKSNSENLKEFIKRWEEKIKEVKKICLDNQQAYNLAKDYISEWEPFMSEDEVFNKEYILSQLAHDLFLAIAQANNNYKKEFPSFWNNLHKLNLPDLHFHKK